MQWEQPNKRKSPLMAKILSFIIPGLGHFYCENYIAGLICLLVSIPFIIGSILSIYLIVQFNYMMSPKVKFAFFVLPVFYSVYLQYCAGDAGNRVDNYNERIENNKTYPDNQL